MFESTQRLREDIQGLLEALRSMTDGRYACVMEPGNILLESPEAEGREITTLRRLLELNGAAIFALPAAMADDGPGPAEDPFEGWEHDDLCLVFLNGKVAVVMACADAEAAREAVAQPMRVMADRLLRLESRYRLDARGRGLFFGQPRLDYVTISRHDK